MAESWKVMSTRMSRLEVPIPHHVVADYFIRISALTLQSLLRDDRAMHEIKQSDLMITEHLFFSAPLIAEAAGIPRIDFVASMMTVFGRLHKIPMPPSYVPSSFTLFTEKMTFSERTVNALSAVAELGLLSIVMERMLDRLKQEFHIAPHKSAFEITRKPLAILVQADFAIEFAHPLPPHVHFVGAVLPRPAQALSSELESFMQESGEHGVVVVAFGTYVTDSGPKPWIQLNEALCRLKQRVIWKTAAHFATTSPNVKIVEWLPQNDLLGHKQTRAFISHMGHNSAYEAAYHGVPVVGAPIMPNDQPAVASKMANKAKMAIVVDFRTANSAKWQEAIEEVINNPRYKGNATRVSKLLRSRPQTPMATAIGVIEQVIAAGLDSSHLHNVGLDQNVLVEQSYDVMAFVCISLLAIVWVASVLIAKAWARIRSMLFYKRKSD